MASRPRNSVLRLALQRTGFALLGKSDSDENVGKIYIKLFPCGHFSFLHQLNIIIALNMFRNFQVNLILTEVSFF